MFNKKQLYLIGSLALALSLVLVQVQVKAAWTNPGTTPGGTTTNPPLTNPLTADLNLGGKSLTNGASATFISGTFNGLDLKNGNLVNVGKINGFTPGAGGLTNPLTEDIDGDNKQSIKKLMGCDPAKNEICGAVEGQAGKSAYSNSFSAGIYGYTQASSGVNPSYGVYGLAMNSGGYGVYGLAMDRDAIGGYFQNSVPGGKALVTNGLTELNGNLNVIGNADVSNMLNGKDAAFSGTVEVTGATTMEGFAIMQNGANVQGALRVDISPVSLDSAIVGNANGTNYDINAGVEGLGTVGVYGDGHLVGIFGISPGYGGIFKGYTATGWGPPPGGGMDASGIDDVAHDFITGLFGVEKTWAGLETAGAVGLVAAGGWQYGSSFSNAGLGICALSGEKAHYVDTTGGGDFQAYCKSGTANNFSGFFAGDIYVKDGSIQFNDTLAAAGENLIYGNIDAASVAGSSLIKLQNNSVNKFVVDKDGASTFSNLILNKNLGATDNLIFANVSAIAGSNLIDLQVGNSSKFKVTRDGITTFGSSLSSPANLTLSGNASIIRFTGLGTSWPACSNLANEGAIYYGKTNHVLCICTGTGGWQSLDNEYSDSACSNTSVPPVPLH